ncbi:hypothetical protein [Actinoplanes sp. N902-109]|uniref:hypothetical protein n=1 Tax=Actinoplanes sp. (strain N902-109) TaxID=649831 RepID=UPI00032949F7|nr:hypothetical protein [Actinoplanes sp. N902-109]AGL15801.1 hypothetical protein L083_2291 [Actinoplanes sp. N902-109]
MHIVSSPSTTAYPIPAGTPADGLTDDIVNAVADLLQSHGYPLIADGPDLDRLRAHLDRFLYGGSAP